MLVRANGSKPAARRFQAGVLRLLGHGGADLGSLAAVDDAAASGGGDCLCHVPICYAAVGPVAARAALDTLTAGRRPEPSDAWSSAARQRLSSVVCATSQTRSFSTKAGICAPLTRRNGAGLDPETS
jgi:hypothetical protein